MTETLRWWLAATAVGLVAWPYTFRLFRFLPDRGATVARILGIVLAIYPLWLLSVVGLLSYTGGGAVLVLLVLGTGGLWLAGRDRQEMLAYLRAHRAYLIAAELVFAALLIGIAAFRAYQPAIDATEKLFELSMLTGVLRSERMPPADPWFGGEPLSYYYGGYLVAALFIKLTGVSAAYGFNLAVALTGALVGAGAFGIGANLAIARSRRSELAAGDGPPAVGDGEHPAMDDAMVAQRPAPPDLTEAGARDGGAGASLPRDPASPASAARSLLPVLRVPRSAYVAGLLSVLLLLVIGNLEGVLELAVAHGWGDMDFYRRLGILGLVPPPEELARRWALQEHWYPDGYWFWWRATRMGSDWNIMEMPFFSLMLGDLHAHLMVYPFTLLGLVSLFNLLRGGGRLDLAALRRRPLEVLYLGVLAGVLALSNSWDQPVFLLLLLATALTLNLTRAGLTWRAAGEAAAFTGVVGLLSFLLFLPFFVHLHPATQGIRPIEILYPPEGVNREAMVSPPHHYLIVWGPLLVVAASGIIAQARRRKIWRAPVDAWTLALSVALAPMLMWAAAVIGVHTRAEAMALRATGMDRWSALGRGVLTGFDALGREVWGRTTAWALGSYWIVQLTVLGLVLLGLLLLLTEGRRPLMERRAARLYMALAVTGGLFVLHVIEFFYVLEPAPSRINTLFKFSFIVWLLLATAGGGILIDVFGPWWRGRERLGPLAWAGAVTAVLALALVYPVTAAFNRTNGFTGPRTLDGLAFLRQANPDEYAAITWLNQNLPGRPLILEAPGENYSQAGRISGRTGFPTVIGWQGHQAKLRGGRDYEAQERRVRARAADVSRIYSTLDPEEARILLDRYGVDYVYLGWMELAQFGTAGVAKFGELGTPVYRNRSVTIYHVGDGGPALGSAR